jgi:1-deoxy-D-xylulose-5-phosphate reductoisomerase
MERFPSLQLAYEAGRTGGTMPAVLNAANEVAVQHFLLGNIKFTDIPDLVAHVMSHHQVRAVTSVNDILQCDQNARELTWERIAKRRIN